MPAPLPDFAEIGGIVRDAGLHSGDFSTAEDGELITALRAISAARHELERCQALAAAEVSRRSRPAFGSQGLARRDGHATTTALLQQVTGATRRETAALVQVGAMAAEALVETSAVGVDESVSPACDAGTDSSAGGGAHEAGLPHRRWHAALGAAVALGELTVAVADAIRTGLGPVDEGTILPAFTSPGEQPGGGSGEESADVGILGGGVLGGGVLGGSVKLVTLLAAELPALIDRCRDLAPEAARRAARQLRDRYDVPGVEARAEAQQRAQFWRVWVKPDGMVRGEFELEPETGMYVKAVFEQLAHPRHTDSRVRRRFGDPVTGDTSYSNARADRERRAAEGLAQLLHAGADADPGHVLNEQRPSVRVIVNSDPLSRGHGTGLIEGHPDRIPLTRIHTRLCDGHLPIRFHGGAPMDLGRDERLFTTKQKAVLAVRDGGCLDPDCDRPPSWTQAHHINHWQRDRGRTDLADGILLCERDHLRYHNEGWEVRRDGTTYWLIPPPHVDPAQTPRHMRPKTPGDVINPIDPTRLPAYARAAEPTRPQDRTAA